MDWKETATQALLKGTDPLISKVVSIDPTHTGAISIECERSENFEAIAGVIVSLVAQNPGEAQDVFRDFMYRLNAPVDPKSGNVLIMGMALGFFQSILWLDKHWGVKPSFDQAFLDRVLSIAFYRGPREASQDSLPWKRFEGLLSQAVKAYVTVNAATEHPDYETLKARRLGVLIRTFTTIRERLKWQKEKEKEVSRLGLMMLDELCYAHFGLMSTTGRVGLFADFHKSIIYVT